jgi:hypothetical protein
VNAHRAYVDLDLEAVRLVMRHSCILDTRRCLDEDKVRASGFAYRALGVRALNDSGAA